MQKGLSNLSINEPQTLEATNVPSSVVYLMGSLIAGASYVDFTPSETLEIGDLEACAIMHRTQVAGRDGSTGQTWLKLSVASTLLIRNFTIDGWYSSNVLGNRDGYALSHDLIAETKMADKARGLNELVPRVGSNHKIDITYLPTLRDVKESWDLVEFRDCFGNAGSLRLNWRANDSPLAVQVLLDLIRLMSADAHEEPTVGLRRDLGLFFKNPLGVDNVSPVRQFQELIDNNVSLMADGVCRDLW